MENRLGLRYKTFLIKCCHKTKGFDAVFIWTVNLAFKRLKPKRTKIQKVQQGTIMRVSGKRKECVKKNKCWLCSTYFQMKQSKYKKLKTTVKTKIHFTFFNFFGLNKMEEVEIRHVPSYCDKNQLPYLASTQIVCIMISILKKPLVHRQNAGSINTTFFFKRQI